MCGEGFKIWITYQRLVLRSSYRQIQRFLEDVFDTGLSLKSILLAIKEIARRYARTEELLLKRLQASSYVHVDETTWKIQGVSWHVWVFTNGREVIYRLTETKESAVIREVLGEYGGVLVSDFYPGFDNMSCRQQKCWVHLIREINNDLWKAPHDDEFAELAQQVKGLIVPILGAVQRFGMKHRNLGKFRRQVEQFYTRTIQDRWYRSDNAVKYQTRFLRYRHSLFTFLDQDGIPWHNNTAENALRHVISQRDISSSFYESMTHSYLRLLGACETCRFQGKSFLDFLLSGETDVDRLTRQRRKTFDPGGQLGVRMR